MNKDKQIEEMAKDLLNVSEKVSNIIMEETHEFLSQNHKYNSLKDFHEAHKKGRNVMEAEFLTELGYAKASEVAREIFEEIDNIFRREYLSVHKSSRDPDLIIMAKSTTEFTTNELWGYVRELKKKYTEGENEN